MAVTPTSGIGMSVMDWMRQTPQNAPKDLARYVVYWRVFYILAAIGHAFTLITFWFAGVGAMVLFNVFSVGAFILAYVFLMRGAYQVGYWLAITELTLHGILAVICVGTDTGFQNYPFLVLILCFIQPFYRVRISVLIASAILASAVAVRIYAANAAPLYEVAATMEVVMACVSMVTWPLFVLAMVLPFVRASARAEQQIASAFGESERLLLNILPQPIATRLKVSNAMIADNYQNAAVMFADIAGFTALSDRLPPADVVTLLNDVFNAIDEVASRYPVEKIKTIGDAYMAVAGLPVPIDDPEQVVANMALDIRSAVERFEVPGTGEPLQVRIGLNSGKVVAGVIGQKKFAYDLWGDAVNLASRMESTGVIGRIQMTEEFARRLGHGFQIEPRGLTEVKGKGQVETCFLVGRGA
ncbi:MAG: adenylate/guanylate cyclase domain-containing protein [Pseudomonadota bacterium]